MGVSRLCSPGLGEVGVKGVIFFHGRNKLVERTTCIPLGFRSYIMLGLAVPYETYRLRPCRWRRWRGGLQGGGHGGRAVRQQGDDECDACQLAQTCCTAVLNCCDAPAAASSPNLHRAATVCAVQKADCVLSCC